MDNQFAAHHEAGHAVVTKLLGGEITSLGLKPTPHCIPDVDGMSDEDIATICMAGAAATMLTYGTMGPCETDRMAAKHYVPFDMPYLMRAIKLLEENRDMLDDVTEALLAEIPKEERYKKCYVCVDTVRAVMDNGPDIDTEAQYLSR